LLPVYNSYSGFKTPEDRFYLMLKDDGSVWSWGNNDYGTLGDGTYDRRDVPVQVDGLVNIVALKAGRGQAVLPWIRKDLSGPGVPMNMGS